jgi:hypothetical protein
MLTNNKNVWSIGGAGSSIHTLGNNHMTDNATTSVR